MTAARYRWQVAGKAKDQVLGCGARKFVRAHSCRRYLVKIPVPVPMRFPSLAFPTCCFPCPWLFLSPGTCDLTPASEMAKAAGLSAGSPRRPAAISCSTPRLRSTYV